MGHSREIAFYHIYAVLEHESAVNERRRCHFEENVVELSEIRHPVLGNWVYKLYNIML